MNKPTILPKALADTLENHPDLTVEKAFYAGVGTTCSILKKAIDYKGPDIFWPVMHGLMEEVIEGLDLNNETKIRDTVMKMELNEDAPS